MIFPKDIVEKYPRAVKFLREHPEFDLDQAIEFLDDELKKREETLNESRSDFRFSE